MTAPQPPEGGSDAAAGPSAPPGASGRRTSRACGDLADDELAAEIELYTEVVLAASESEGPLDSGDLDRLLGVREHDRDA